MATHSWNIFYGFILILLLRGEHLSAKRHKKPWFCDNKQDEPISFLWSVRREPAAYFFGTIHVPYTRVWDFIPENAKQAFESVDNVFFELDLMEPRTIAALARCQLLPKGESLVDLLPGQLYSRLKKHLDYVKGMMSTWMTADQRGRGLYADYLFNAIAGNWERKRPVWVMLMVNSLTESDVRSRGTPVLDLYLAQEAERMNKRAGAVERVEEQCVPLNGLNFTQVVFALNQTLSQQEGVRMGQSSYTTEDLIKHYNCGDLDAVVFNQDTTQVPTLGVANASLMGFPPIELARTIDDYFRDELIYKRNRRMGQRVAHLLRNYPQQSFFFAFGAGHYLGNSTVLDFVAEEGFQVEQVPPHRKLKTTKKSRESQQYVDWGSEGNEASVRGPRRPQKSYHSTVHLLRTTSAPPKKKFNDLWVRLETTRGPYTSSREAHEEDESLRKSLRFWYGLSNRGWNPRPLGFLIMAAILRSINCWPNYL